MEIYNSLARRRETLPLPPADIRMYSCGVTVYDRCHIGHARSLYTFDSFVKYMRYRGYRVRFVRNITDVDDKIITKAVSTGRTFDEVVRENIALYVQDLASLGIAPADCEPRATENVPLMVKHIEKLVDKGHAYVVNGEVYFRVRSFAAYGRLSGQSIDKMREGVRIEKDEKKEDPLDFVLWKNAGPGEPSWPSPWGAGRPGWHIECSCMSMKHLETETLDIHAGGRDLIFPHHENEIAQAEALTGKTFARIWMHHGLLTIDNQKMSKSLGNFITVQDVLSKYSLNAVKLFFLSTHYASSIDYSDGKLADMEKGSARFAAFVARAARCDSPRVEVKPADVDFLNEARKKIIASLDEDFNTAAALGHMFDLVGAANRFMDAGRKDDCYEGSVRAVVDVVKELMEDVFGIIFESPLTGLSSEETSLLEERVNARKARDWKRSDELRDMLKGKGILVEDARAGQTWRRV